MYYIKKYKTNREWFICLKYTDTWNMLHWLWIELKSNSVFADYVRLWLTVVSAVLLCLLRHRALAPGRVMAANCYASKLFLLRIVVFCPAFCIIAWNRWRELLKPTPSFEQLLLGYSLWTIYFTEFFGVSVQTKLLSWRISTPQKPAGWFGTSCVIYLPSINRNCWRIFLRFCRNFLFEIAQKILLT